jgi:diguanylate cyclase (GGDEF)-like protein
LSGLADREKHVAAASIRPRRFTLVVVPVCAAGLAVLLAAAASFATASHSAGTPGLVLLLLAGTTVAERFPVPVPGAEANGISLGYVFAVAATVLFGWDAGVFVALGAPVLMQLLEHRPPVRIAYNGAMFGLAAAAGGGLASLVDGSSAAVLFARVATVSATYYTVNVLLFALVIFASGDAKMQSALGATVRASLLLFALMASGALMLVVLWERSPALSAALVGPLIAIVLYQRSTFRELNAMRLALTDPLTGLGNHRQFHERLQHALVEAEDDAISLALCLLDVDDFKQINDLYGHPVGDRVLSEVAGKLPHGGEAFRLGGDEFALLLLGLDEPAAAAAAQSVVDRVASSEVGTVGRITISAGLAIFPSHGSGRDELIQNADSALYWAKHNGKNRARSFRPELVRLGRPGRPAEPVSVAG